ncbi:speckle targeted PIP5K1A-regulated poly(A) polymerase [Procambarus clarkii]|uniref:speckle targeted PIP5K1A-regulated poly(A) polymerase n=1 Tax=Procambarus clarkii TaxID=6728 RepID=UPI003742568F
MSNKGITSAIQATYKCTACKTSTLDKCAYITHILGKKHQKQLKSKNLPQPNDEHNRTIHVTGYDRSTPVEAVLGVFLQYGVRNINHHYNYSFIEFESVDMVKKVLRESHYCRDTRLQVSASHRKSHNQSTGDSMVTISTSLSEKLKERVKGRQLDLLIDNLIREIELKPEDYRIREYLRSRMVQFLMRGFPRVFGFVFGSSANNLGFRGCDVDMYVDIGVNPWASCYSRAEAESKASDLTFYLAREIRQSKMGIKVQAVARARVPIVKFQDANTGLLVDLSFRHGMPVYNTQLIYSYSKAHPLVRPYLMLVRYWAKIQGVAGGGQPSFLITNYALTMLMLFYLMSRDDPIIPCVSDLKENQTPELDSVIGGWDCSFNRDMSEWNKRTHNVTVMELARDFFTFYGNLEASKWVISPLAGKLIDKNDFKDKELRKLPICMTWYCRQNVEIQLNTALCLQDPFEHSHNCTRGLREGPLAEFQYKCRKAAEICDNIVKGQQSLSDFLKTIEISPNVLKEICSSVSPKEMDQSVEEIITLDDSDCASQDSIEVLNLSSEKESESGTSPKSKRTSRLSKDITKINNLSENEDVIIVISGDSREVLTKSIKNGSTSTKTEVSENGVDESKEGSDVSIILPEVEPEKKIYKFPLLFSQIPEFSITFDGAVSGGKGIMTAADDIGHAACSIVHFALQQCLKVDVSVIEAFMGDRKRKSFTQDDNSDTGKRIKGADGESVPILTKFRRLSQYHCVAVSQLWVGRKKISKRVPMGKNVTPLQYELAVTEVQISDSGVMISSNSQADSDKLNFIIELWQKCNEPSNILVTGDSRSNLKVTRAQMIPMFTYLTSLTQSLLRKVMLYVVGTASKR